MDYITHEYESLVLGSLGGLHELIVKVVSAHGVRQFAEIHLEQRRHRVDVLKHGPVVVQIWHTVLVEGHPAITSQVQILVVGKNILHKISCKSVAYFKNKNA